MSGKSETTKWEPQPGGVEKLILEDEPVESDIPARNAIALSLAMARTSPPEYASATDSDRKMADHIIKLLKADGWNIRR